MTFKNSVKLLFSNFNIVWKMMLYFLVLTAVFLLSIYLLLAPVVKLVDSAGFFAQMVDIYKQFLTTMNLPKALEMVSHLVENIFIFIKDNIASIWWNFGGVILVVGVISPILTGLVKMASCVSLNFYMGSLTKQGFYTSFKDVFAKNIKFEFAYFLVTLPLKVLSIAVMILSLGLFRISWYVSIIAVFVLFIEFILFLALKYTLFSTWIPTTVVLNFGVFKSLKVGIKFVFKRFWRVFGTAIGLVLSLTVLNVVFGLFTFMVGLIFSIPISYLMISIFGMVLTYEGQGMRYYVDIYNVITPKKKEVSDKLKDMKYVV